MRQATVSTLLALLMLCPASLAEELLIPKETRVPFVFKSSSSTVQFRKGDKVQVEIVEDVRVGNHLIFRKGDQGSAVIKSRTRPGVMGMPGTIDVRQAYLPDINGNQHEVTTKYQAVGSMTHLPGAMVGSSVVFPVLLPITAFMFFRKGKDVSLPEGIIVDGFTVAESSISVADAPASDSDTTGQVEEAPLKSTETDELKALIEKLNQPE